MQPASWFFTGHGSTVKKHFKFMLKKLNVELKGKCNIRRTVLTRLLMVPVESVNSVLQFYVTARKTLILNTRVSG